MEYCVAMKNRKDLYKIVGNNFQDILFGVRIYITYKFLYKKNGEIKNTHIHFQQKEMKKG